MLSATSLLFSDSFEMLLYPCQLLLLDLDVSALLSDFALLMRQYLSQALIEEQFLVLLQVIEELRFLFFLLSLMFFPNFLPAR